MEQKHPPSHYMGGWLKPWWRRIQKAEDRQATEAEEAEER